MAFTKIYLDSATAPYAPATLRGAWDQTAQVVTGALRLEGTGNGVRVAVVAAETNVSPTWDVLLYRGVSGPLAAQTISGTLDLIVGVDVTNVLADFYWHVHVYVTQGDSDTPRGTLLSDYVENTTNEWPDNNNGEPWALQSPQSLSSLAISAGDRLVVEIGFIARNAVTTSRSGAVVVGTLSASTFRQLPDLELGVNDSLTGAAHLIFSNAITEIAETRYYFTSYAAPYGPPTFRGAWDDTAGAVIMGLDVDKTIGGNVATVTRAETNVANNYDVCLYRGVSGPLEAQTIAGRTQIGVVVSESSGSLNGFFHLHIYVTQGDSDTPRGTLLTDVIGTVEWGTTGGGRELTTGWQALSSLAISAGDRIVVEIGYQAQNVSGSSFSGSMNYGTIDTDTYYPYEAAPLGNTAGASFITFDSPITEENVAIRGSHVVMEVMSAGATAPIRGSHVVLEVMSPGTPDVPILGGERMTMWQGHGMGGMFQD